MTAPALGNLVPYLFYTDVEAMIDWYSRVFGFVEKARWCDSEGRVGNAEMSMGDTELWMDADATIDHSFTRPGGEPHPLWIGVRLADRAAVDAMYDHIVSKGGEPQGPPVDRPFGIRTFTVADPEGYTWGFLCPIRRSDLP